MGFISSHNGKDDAVKFLNIALPTPIKIKKRDFTKQERKAVFSFPLRITSQIQLPYTPEN